MEPMLPPIIATIKRVASGIRKALFFRFMFINAHEGEPNQVDCCKI